MTSEAPSSAPFISRLLASYKAEDALGIRLAITDARDAGIPISYLVTVLIGTLAYYLEKDGYDVESDSQGLLAHLALAQTGGLS